MDPNTPIPQGTIQDNKVLAIGKCLKVLVLTPSTLYRFLKLLDNKVLATEKRSMVLDLAPSLPYIDSSSY